MDAQTQRRVLSILSRMTAATLTATATTAPLASPDALTTREPQQATTRTVNPPAEPIETEDSHD